MSPVLSSELSCCLYDVSVACRVTQAPRNKRLGIKAKCFAADCLRWPLKFEVSYVRVEVAPPLF